MTLLMRDQENIEKGRAEGRAEGRADINKLNAVLIKLNRFDDLKRSVEDEAFQKHLIEELFSKGI